MEGRVGEDSEKRGFPWTMVTGLTCIVFSMIPADRGLWALFIVMLVLGSALVSRS